MSLIVFVVVAGVFAGLALGVRARPRVVNAVGIIGLGATLVAAILIQPGQVVVVEGGGLATTAYLRLFLVLGSLVGLGLAVTGLAGGSRRDAPAVTLGILATGGLTLGLVDPRAAVLVATAGGLFGVLVTLLPTNGRAGATVGIRETRAVIVSGALAIAATAWFGRDLSQLAAQPVVFGLAYLAFAVAVAMRFGAIPFHLWAARLSDVVPEAALPILTALAPATLAIVALAWTDASVAPLLVDLWRGPADRAVDRDRVDRPRRRGRVRAGRHRARARLFDRRRRRRGHAGPGHPGPRRLGAGADLDPRLRRGPQRVRGLGGRDPGGLLHRTGRRPARLGASLADPRRRARRRRHRDHRLARDSRPSTHGRPSSGWPSTSRWRRSSSWPPWRRSRTTGGCSRSA